MGVSTRKRSPALPNVPTIAEAGLPAFEDSTFNGLMAPAGTPRPVIDRLHEAVMKAAGTAELHKRFLDQGIELVASKTPEAFGQFLRDQVKTFARLAQETGMSANQ